MPIVRRRVRKRVRKPKQKPKQKQKQKQRQSVSQNVNVKIDMGNRRRVRRNRQDPSPRPIAPQPVIIRAPNIINPPNIAQNPPVDFAQAFRLGLQSAQPVPPNPTILNAPVEMPPPYTGLANVQPFEPVSDLTVTLMNKTVDQPRTPLTEKPIDRFAGDRAPLREFDGAGPSPKDNLYKSIRDSGGDNGRVTLNDFQRTVDAKDNDLVTELKLHHSEVAKTTTNEKAKEASLSMLKELNNADSPLRKELRENIMGNMMHSDEGEPFTSTPLTGYPKKARTPQALSSGTPVQPIKPPLMKTLTPKPVPTESSEDTPAPQKPIKTKPVPTESSDSTPVPKKRKEKPKPVASDSSEEILKPTPQKKPSKKGKETANELSDTIRTIRKMSDTDFLHLMRDRGAIRGQDKKKGQVSGLGSGKTMSFDVFMDLYHAITENPDEVRQTFGGIYKKKSGHVRDTVETLEDMIAKGFFSGITETPVKRIKSRKRK